MSQAHRPLRVYVFGSFRRLTRLHLVLKAIREAGISIVNDSDFETEPTPSSSRFHWAKIAVNFQQWRARELKSGLNHPLAKNEHQRIQTQIASADVMVFILPCGRSLYGSFMYARGQGKPGYILLDTGHEPDLSYLHATETLYQTVSLVQRLLGVYESLQRKGSLTVQVKRHVRSAPKKKST